MGQRIRQFSTVAKSPGVEGRFWNWVQALQLASLRIWGKLRKLAESGSKIWVTIFTSRMFHKRRTRENTHLALSCYLTSHQMIAIISVCSSSGRVPPQGGGESLLPWSGKKDPSSKSSCQETKLVEGHTTARKWSLLTLVSLASPQTVVIKWKMVFTAIKFLMSSLNSPSEWKGCCSERAWQPRWHQSRLCLWKVLHLGQSITCWAPIATWGKRESHWYQGCSNFRKSGESFLGRCLTENKQSWSQPWLCPPQSVLHPRVAPQEAPPGQSETTRLDS